MSEQPVLLRVRGLDVVYKGRRRRDDFPALRDVSFAVRRAETYGLVGESGSGKSTIGRAILGLVPVARGTIAFEQKDITGLRGRGRRRLAADIQVVFQDPYTSLNPSMEVEDILAEPLTIAGWTRSDARRRIAALLDDVRLPADSGRRLPREFSGGQRQRIAIARAMALQPKLIVCDEPVSALDLTTQELVLQLFVDIQEATGVSYLFITHDLAVVRHISHQVGVLYRGDLVEHGRADAVTSAPQHPYTQRLFMSAPVPDPARQAERRAQRRALADAPPRAV
ncbi:ABC transporter ATP-binding protein [Microbacterium sp. 18062]|uniref:ABC transporter ATP-binding protein n=1 Tax=Microbacterium sp. 18062 TaxID=2681410 RepID=UPI0013569A3A|nr:ATP-binding cassette domain-containing protein [Microbacterium sp. 18062]